MDALTAAILARTLERLTDVLVGAGCIYLGWKLFTIVGEDNRSEATVGWLKFKLTLKRVGPGTLFAGFGALIVSMSFLSTLHFKDVEGKPGAPATMDKTSQPNAQGAIATAPDVNNNQNTKDVNYAEDVSKQIVKEQVVSLNKILKLLQTDPKNQGVLLAGISDLTAKKDILTAMRDAKLASIFGPIQTELWKKDEADYEVNPTNVRFEDRSAVKEVSDWLSTGE
jgi:hypothetical protein